MIAELKLKEPLKKTIAGFIDGLKKIYTDDLISVILYGSAASNEFSEHFSNLNLLVILKNTGLCSLKKATGLVNHPKFRIIQPLFLTEDYITKSLDVFPVEFIDMQENYSVLYGKDILKGINIDTKNLRFQCEQELKVKLITLKQQYLKISRDDKKELSYLLFKSFTSVLYLLRNVLRLKLGQAPYLKEDILKSFSAEFKIDTTILKRILVLKNNPKKVTLGEILVLLDNFVIELERIIEIIDEL